MAPPPLMLVSDAQRIGRASFLDALQAGWDHGLEVVQIREPDPEELLVEVAQRRPRGTAIIVNGHADLCLRMGLDGVHVGGGDVRLVRAARYVVGPGAVIGYSAHALDELGPAAEAGADYVTFSPVHGALSKVHPLPAVGVEGLAKACASTSLPVYALGGMTPETTPAVRAAGATGVATIGAVLDVERPGDAVAEFLSAWASAD